MNRQAQPHLEATTYDRSNCQIGIVHLGFGAFHRAHQAVYIDQYLEATGDLRWGIAAVNLRAADTAAFEAVQKASEGYLLKTTSPNDHVRYQLVRSHVAYADWSKDTDQAEDLVCLDSVKAITLTVTESGYYLDDNWSLDVSQPVIAAEIRGERPTSIYGYLAGALARRATAGGAPITVLCCDNIRSNGEVLQRNFVKYLKALGKSELLGWVQENVSFPCSMVDRITPRTSDALADEVARAFPLRDLAPIHGESFIQWVIEDRFAGEMPDLSRVGVQVVSNVHPFEEAKIRILNGGHTGLCYLGALAGYDTFDEAMRDPELRSHFDRFEADNVLVGLQLELPFDREDYVAQIAARFSNRAIADDLARICMDGWSKFPIFVHPTMEGCLAQGVVPEAAFDSVASWYVYARRWAAGKMHVPYNEPYWELLKPLLEPGQEFAFARCKALWSQLPEEYEEFAPGLERAIKRMEEKWPA